jgi:putative PIN family toxin of toxin-antitoxin system
MAYLQAATSDRGPAAEVLRRGDADQVTLLVSAGILREVRAVLLRPEVRRRNDRLTPERVDEFLAHLSAKAVPIAEVPKRFSLPRDPKDESYLNLALAAGARYLVTWDNDLLDLMHGKEFLRDHPGLTILTPPDFLHEPPQERTPWPEEVHCGPWVAAPADGRRPFNLQSAI